MASPHPRRALTITTALLSVSLAYAIVRGATAELARGARPAVAVPPRASPTAASVRPPRTVDAPCADRGGPFLPPGRYALFVVPGLDPLGAEAIPARVCATTCAGDAGRCRDDCADRTGRAEEGCVVVRCRGDRDDGRTTARIWLR